MNRRRQTLLLGLAGLAIGLVAMRLLCLQGLVGPVQIAGGSMAPTMLGIHYSLSCDDCRLPFRCDATSRPETDQAVCPNCGFPANELAPTRLVPGQRVLIDRLAYVGRSPRRWDLVAFPDPPTPTRKAVKRVVGLPGETIEIRRGDLFVDGRILRKPLPVQQQLSVLVHDDRFRPSATADLPPRWQSAGLPDDTSGWSRQPTGYAFSPSTPAITRPAGEATGEAHVDWLTYRNWRCFSSPLERTATTPVFDHYGYNQNTSRELHAVTDLWLSCRLTWQREGVVRLRVQDDGDRFVVEISRRQQQASLRRNDAVVGNFPCRLPATGHLQFGICDRQVFLVAGARKVFCEPFERAGGSRLDRASAAVPPAPEDRLAIGGAGGRLQVEELKVFRDVYYLGPFQQDRPWQVRVAPDSVLVLGDNVPVSRDSRNWRTASLPRKSLLGRVLRPF